MCLNFKREKHKKRKKERKKRRKTKKARKKEREKGGIFNSLEKKSEGPGDSRKQTRVALPNVRKTFHCVFSHRNARFASSALRRSRAV